ncbi:YodC family protein [Thalassotalea mangrovi]|uniref:DUF2158 domain-containing protein n=1 Tax=Thalassotalea mangrovi TaxID=2572245 RepID=A0A4U1B3Z0_9GAMM|nr:DUF2158 domain-containing protein [Thalassotalea mangrovi]TKB43977.1 DUF2158 domain-containing protein [Thalassotalea mangrovi]
MSNTIKLKSGDIVMLKSGGPEMTVKEEVSPNNYKCQWFAGKKLDMGVFPFDSLTTITAEG